MLTGMPKPRAAVLYGLGLNTDRETEYALGSVGFDTKRVHINDLIDGNESLANYQFLGVPGGFADGDVLGAGKIFAFRLRRGLSRELYRFIDDGKLIFGACNGFQIMVKACLLPGFDNDYKTQQVTLASNDSGRFEDRWVYLEINPESPCIFTKGIERVYLGVRHGEGKLIPKDEKVYQKLNENGHIVLWYTDQSGNRNPPYPLNPNGSIDGIAGICDETGRVFGMMPHPEAYIDKTNHPRWTRKDEEIPEEGMGLQIFRNAVNYFR